MKAIEILGGICVVCGTSENLEFDHIDPATKDPRLKIQGINFNWNWVWVLEEIAKCQLLCQQHHLEKSLKNKECGTDGKPGEQNGNAKLTEDDIRAMRLSTLSNRTLANIYGIHWATVSKIKKRQRWSHVK